MLMLHLMYFLEQLERNDMNAHKQTLKGGLKVNLVEKS